MNASGGAWSSGNQAGKRRSATLSLSSFQTASISFTWCVGRRSRARPVRRALGTLLRAGFSRMCPAPYLLHPLLGSHTAISYSSENNLMAQPFNTETLQLSGDVFPVAADASFSVTVLSLQLLFLPAASGL